MSRSDFNAVQQNVLANPFFEWGGLWPEPLFLTDRCGKITWRNPRAQQDYPEELGFFDLFSSSGVRAQVKAWCEKAKPGQTFQICERSRIGNVHEKSLRWTLVLDALGEQCFASASDFSRLQHATDDLTRQVRHGQENYLQISKLSSIGEMTTGIAHEINNPLAVILSKVMIGQKALKAETTDLKLLEQVLGSIESTTQRIAKIVQGIRSFARDGSRDQPEPYPIKQIIDETLSLCRNRLEKDQIELAVGQIPEDLRILCVPVQVSQVLVNLINNARDASLAQSKRWIRIEAIEEEEFVRIEVTDCGNGVAADVRAKIMEPFFTTKGAGNGTGLGLSISKTIVEAHRGRIWLDLNSENTRFCVSLPKPKQSN